MPPPLPRAGATWSRSVVVRDAIELCAHGLRVRSPSGTVELTWDQVVAVEREELVGELHQVRVVGTHGEVVTFDRNVPELLALASELAAAVERARREP